VNTKTIFFYSLGAFGKNVMYAMSSVLQVFYTAFLGINPFFIGMMFMIVRFWDAINDPIMGKIVQNTKTRFGKFRPWILIGSIINAVVLLFVFKVPDLESNSVLMLVYVSFVYTIWGMSYTLADIPFWSMLPTFSKSQKDREKVTISARIGAQMGLAVVGAPYLVIVKLLGKGDNLDQMIEGFFKLSIVVSIVFVITQILVFIFVKDKYSSSEEDSMSLKEMVKSLKENDQLMVVAGVVLLFNSVIFMTSTVAFYYIKYDLGEVVLFGRTYDYAVFNMIFIATGFFVQLISMASYQIYSIRMKRKKVFELGIIISIIGFVLLFMNAFVFGNNVYGLIVYASVVFYGLGLLMIAQTVLLVDTVEYGEWKSGKRSESLVFSIQTFVVKLATGLSMGFVGIGLSLVNFDPALDFQSTKTIMGIRIMMFILPIIGILLALKIFRSNHKLDEEMFASIMIDLENR